MSGLREDVLNRQWRSSADDDFARWVGPHVPVLRAIAVQLGGASESADLVQETLLRAWQKRRTFDPQRGSTRAWLVTLLYDRARRQRTRAAPTSPAGDVGPPANGVSVEESIDIADAIAKLPPRQRQIVALHYIGDLTLAQVADTLNITVGATKSQLHDAKNRLREFLGIGTADD